MDLLVRPALPADAGVPLLFESAKPYYTAYAGSERRALKLLRAVWPRPGHAASYEFCRVAVAGDRLVGVVAGFPVAAGDQLSRRFVWMTLRRLPPWRIPATLRPLRGAAPWPAPPRAPPLQGRRRRPPPPAARRLLRRRARRRPRLPAPRGRAATAQDGRARGRERRSGPPRARHRAAERARPRALQRLRLQRARDPPRARRPCGPRPRRPRLCGLPQGHRPALTRRARPGPRSCPGRTAAPASGRRRPRRPGTRPRGGRS